MMSNFLEGTTKVVIHNICSIKIRDYNGVSGYMLMTNMSISRNIASDEVGVYYYRNQKRVNYQGVRFLYEASQGVPVKQLEKEFQNMILGDFSEIDDVINRALENLKKNGIDVEMDKPFMGRRFTLITTPEEMEFIEDGRLFLMVKHYEYPMLRGYPLIKLDYSNTVEPYEFIWNIFEETSKLGFEDLRPAGSIIPNEKIYKLRENLVISNFKNGYVIAVYQNSEKFYLKSYQDDGNTPLIRTVRNKDDATAFFYEDAAMEVLYQLNIDLPMEIEEGEFEEVYINPVLIETKEGA